MSPEERDAKITEMHTDLKWIKSWAEEHKKTHSNYLFYFITLVAGIIITWFKK